jgi:hypothetical protein
MTEPTAKPRHREWAALAREKTLNLKNAARSASVTTAGAGKNQRPRPCGLHRFKPQIAAPALAAREHHGKQVWLGGYPAPFRRLLGIRVDEFGPLAHGQESR